MKVGVLGLEVQHEGVDVRSRRLRGRRAVYGRKRSDHLVVQIYVLQSCVRTGAVRSFRLWHLQENLGSGGMLELLEPSDVCRIRWLARAWS